MKIKPLNTEVNRTLLAEQMISSWDEEALMNYAVFCLATEYDKYPDQFEGDWYLLKGDPDE